MEHGRCGHTFCEACISNMLALVPKEAGGADRARAAAPFVPAGAPHSI
jgi:hypothetical protein